MYQQNTKYVFAMLISYGNTGIICQIGWRQPPAQCGGIDVWCVMMCVVGYINFLFFIGYTEEEGYTYVPLKPLSHTRSLQRQ